jgi:hypothetical protein
LHGEWFEIPKQETDLLVELITKCNSLSSQSDWENRQAFYESCRQKSGSKDNAWGLIFELANQEIKNEN